MDSNDAVLWYPETVEELNFIKQMYPIPNGTVYHLGVKNFSSHWGFTFADGTYSPGIPYYTCNCNALSFYKSKLVWTSQNWFGPVKIGLDWTITRCYFRIFRRKRISTF